jgi:hypothetical protein
MLVTGPRFEKTGIQPNLRSITHVANKAHVILRSFIVYTRMHDTMNLVQHVTFNTKEM